MSSSSIQAFTFRDIPLGDVGEGRVPDCKLHATDVHVERDRSDRALLDGTSYVATIGNLICDRHSSDCPVSAMLRSAGNIAVAFDAPGSHLNEIVEAASVAFGRVVYCAPEEGGAPAGA